MIITPIFPNLDWFLKSIFDILISLILFLYNNYEHTIKTTRMTRMEKKKINPVKQIPGILLILFVVAFIAGFLPVKPVAVMSYSMVPTFSRGAVVISTKTSQKDLCKLKVGDILHYKSENGEVIHRIVEIQKDKDGKLYAWGDNTKGRLGIKKDDEYITYVEIYKEEKSENKSKKESYTIKGAGKHIKDALDNAFFNPLDTYEIKSSKYCSYVDKKVY